MRRRITADLTGHSPEEITKFRRDELLELCGESEDSNRPNKAMIRDLLKERRRQQAAEAGLQIRSGTKVSASP